jgi:hypothetical protein
MPYDMRGYPAKAKNSQQSTKFQTMREGILRHSNGVVVVYREGKKKKKPGVCRKREGFFFRNKAEQWRRLSR